MSSTIEKEKILKYYLETMGFLNDSTDDFLYIYDLPSGRVYFANRIDEKYNLPPMTEGAYAIEEVKSFLGPRDLKNFQCDLDELISGDEQIQNREYWLVNQQGERFWIRNSGKLQRDEDGNPQWILGRISDATVGQSVDSLTGLFNARKMTEDLEACLKRNGKGFLSG